MREKSSFVPWETITRDPIGEIHRHAQRTMRERSYKQAVERHVKTAGKGKEVEQDSLARVDMFLYRYIPWLRQALDQEVGYAPALSHLVSKVGADREKQQLPLFVQARGVYTTQNQKPWLLFRTGQDDQGHIPEHSPRMFVCWDLLDSRPTSMVISQHVREEVCVETLMYPDKHPTFSQIHDQIDRFGRRSYTGTVTSAGKWINIREKEDSGEERVRGYRHIGGEDFDGLSVHTWLNVQDVMRNNIANKDGGLGGGGTGKRQSVWIPIEEPF